MPDFGLNRRRFVQAAGATGLAAALPSTAGATPAQAALADDLDLDGGAQEILVVFDSNDHVAQLERFSLPEGYHRFEVLPIGYTIATGDQIQEIAALQSVVHVQPNRELEYHNADAREVTGVSEVQGGDPGYTGENAHVAVIDSGLSGLHPDHRGDVAHNYKYQNPLQRDTAWRDVKPGDTDDNGHGSHVSGTVAGNGTFSETSPVQGQNQKGMAPDAKLTVYSTGLTLLVLNTVAAFDHLLANHTVEFGGVSPEEAVDLTNNSYGPLSGNDADFNPDSALNVATYECYKAGVLSFFSAGNNGPTKDTYSNYAKAPWIVGVAATKDDKMLAGFSSRGRQKDTYNDRQTALANVEDYYAAQSGDPVQSESTGQSDSYSGGPVAGVGAVGAVQRTGFFTIDSYSADSFTKDAYEVRATLTWSPSSPAGPQPSDVDFAMVDADGNTVAQSGSGGTETQSEAEETLTATIGLDDYDSTREYQFEVTGWRGAANWSIEYEVFVVSLPTAPSGPYGVYRPDLGATGVSIVSTMSPNDPLQPTDNGGNESLASPYYAAISGTSMSSPTATGATALIVDAYVDAYDEYPTPEVLFQLLEQEGTEFIDSKHDKVSIGNGFIDATVANRITEVTDDPNATEGGDDTDDGSGTDDGDDTGDGDGSEDDGDDTEDDGDKDENGEGDEEQDENGDEKEENGDEGGDNGEGDDEDGQGGNDVTTVSTSYGF